LEEGADHAAVNRRQDRVADEVFVEGQDAFERAVGAVHRNAQEAGVRYGVEYTAHVGSSPLSGAPARTRRWKAVPARFAPSMNVPRQLAKGSSGPPSYARPRTKATLRVTL